MSTLPKVNKAWVLNEYAKGPVNDSTFKLKELPLPDTENLPKNNVLVKVLRLAMEPAMRPSVSEGKSYRPPHPLGETMWAIGIGEVVASNSNAFAVGSKVTGLLNMQEYALVDAGSIKPYEEKIGLEHLSGLSVAGKAAHIGLFHVGECKKGDVVLVSAAAGATGQAVVQMARAAGASRVIGIASKAKCDSVVKAGADLCLDYGSPNFAEELRKATEEKVNVYFDNTGGPITDAALVCMATFGRIAVCGAISEYQNMGGADNDVYHGIKNWRYVLTSELTIRGFICGKVSQQAMKDADEGLRQFIIDGKVKTDIYTFPQTGIEHCIEAFLGLFSGQNKGKMTIKIAE
ncbi:hypothetical protein CBS101457_002504 [Exobasidium rhododendri]|nr:hypothetical protein CBS101457_002504 [Exobasidium rhododendri]